MSREVNVDEETNFDDGRGGFDQGPKKKIPGLKAFVYFMLLLGLVIMAWIVYRNLPVGQHVRQATTKDHKPDALQNSLPRYAFSTTPSNANSAARNITSPPPPAPSPSRTGVNAGAGGKPELTPAQKALQRRLSDFSNGSDGNSGSSAGGQTVTAQRSDGGSLLGGGREHDSKASAALAQRLGAAPHLRVWASMLAHPEFTIPMGTLIPCGTTTELNSTQPGMVGCQVSRDVYSANGKVRLIDKGTQVVGEVASALAQGQDRVFVLWTRLRTPQNVIVHINSPGTSNLGSAGIPGQVNSHFWKRFGGALLVSVLSDAGQAAIQAAANSGRSGNTTVNLGNTQATGNEMATEVLRATINIPPTLYARQGKAVAIYVARDLDFSSVYKLEYGNGNSVKN